MRRRTAIRYGTTLAVAFLAAVAGCAMPPLDRSVSPKPGPAADNPASQSAEGVKPVNPEYSCSLRKIDVMKAVDGREFNNVAGLRCS
jgi:hypothetical protein